MKTQFELWVKACEEFGDTIYPVEVESDGNGVYATKKAYIGSDWHEYFTDEMFHIWTGGRTHEVTRDMFAAVNMWRSRRKEAAE